MKIPSLLQRIGFIIFTFLLAVSASFSYALEPSLPQIIGQVVWAKGQVKATLPNAEARLLARRSAVYEHDTLTTDATGSGEIVFTDSSVLAIREDSTLQIDKYNYGKGASPQNDAFVVNVAKGGFRTITGAISKNNPGGYKATTPVATIGVSGTIYSVFFNVDKKTMAAKLDQGNIFVSNSKGKLTLTKCGANTPKGAAAVGCIDQLYAEVGGTNIAPVAVQQQPQVFSTEPPVTPTQFPKPAAGGVSGSFCIN